MTAMSHKPLLEASRNKVSMGIKLIQNKSPSQQFELEFFFTLCELPYFSFGLRRLNYF